MSQHVLPLSVSPLAAASSSTTLNSILTSQMSHILGNVGMVGSAWMASSAIWTTYSTTAFLKYPHHYYRDSSSNNVVMPKQLSSTSSNINRSTTTTSTTTESRKINNNNNNNILNIIRDRATLLVLYRFLGSSLLGLLLPPPSSSSHISSKISSTLSSLRPFLLPSTFLFLANYCNSIALNTIGISLTYTSKCAIPLITVLLTLLLDGPRSLPPPLALASLLPVVIGIGAASWNSPAFELMGFAAAMVSCGAQSCLNVVSKRVMMRWGIDGLSAQRAMVCWGFVYASGLTVAKVAIASCFGGGARLGNDDDDAMMDGEKRETMRSLLRPILPPPPPPLSYAILAILAYHVEYCLSFIFVGMVPPVTYGTCDAVRRLMIIISGKMFFGGDKFTALNLVGMGLALSGALLYAYASAERGFKLS